MSLLLLLTMQQPPLLLMPPPFPATPPPKDALTLTLRRSLEGVIMMESIINHDIVRTKLNAKSILGIPKFRNCGIPRNS
jgi:hypothetical protein